MVKLEEMDLVPLLVLQSPNGKALEKLGADVQKGNPLIERK